MSTEHSSLDGALEAAAKDVPEVRDAPEVIEPAAPEPAWEAPGFSKRWKEPSRNALKALHDHAEARAHLAPILEELEGTYGYIGRRDNEFATYRKQFDPIAEAINPYVQGFQMRGMSPQQGIQQVLAFADALSQDPDQTFPYLAGMYKPRDAGQALKALAQAWGADLNQVTQDAPYIDPQVTQLLGGYRNELSQMRDYLFQQQQGQHQAMQASVLNHIAAFEDAADESGKPKYPHFRKVYDDMVMLINLGRVDRNDPNVLAKAYDMAVRFNPELGASIAEKQALEAAARQTAEAKQAAEASRNVSGKPKGQPKAGRLTIEEAMRAAEKQMSA